MAGGKTPVRAWSHVRNRRTDADGKRRPATRRRQPLAMSVVALLVVIALAAGVGCGFLLVRPAIPQSLRSSTASGSITAAKSRFDDARDVTVTVHTGTGRTVASPKSGTITAYGCAPGQTIDSGTSFIAVDEVPLLSLHTAVPPFRDLQSGMRGRDVAALNAELRRLGYAAPDGDAMTWDTILAYNALADTVGAACEGLRSANGVLGAAALRQSSDRVRIASLPATEIPTYEASAHVAQVFAATGIRKDNSGVIMSTAVARTYGAHAGTVLPLVGGARMRVSATFDWPSDGRQPTYGYAIISPGNDTKAYDTCLVRAWPVPDGIESLLRVSIRADAESGVGAAASSTSAGTSGSNETPHAKISRINTTLGSHMPGPADFDARITRYAPLLMFVIAMALGFASVCMRRIEIASALHAGYPKTAMLLQLSLETLATVAASCVACLPVVAIVPLILTGSGDAMPVVAMLCRVPGAMSVGMLAGTAVGGMAIRERQLFAYFKARA